MYPRLFGHPFLNTYGISVCIGLVFCFAAGRYYARVKKLDPKWTNFLEGNAYIAILCGFLFAAFGQAGFSYLANPEAGFRVLASSRTFFAGLIGGVSSFLIGYFVYGRKKFGPRLVEVLPIAPFCIAIAHAWGRVGCFFGGCCYGKPTSGPLGITFPRLGYPAYPTQLFEATFLFLLFGVLFYLTIWKNFKHGFSLYMVCYGTFRFFIEFVRDDDRGAFIGALSPSQAIAIAMVSGAIPVYFAIESLLRNYRDNPVIQNKIL